MMTLRSFPNRLRPAVEVRARARKNTLSALTAAATLMFLLLSGCFGGGNNSNTPTGVAFASPQQFSVGQAPKAITTYDINGDGKPDLVVANSGGNTVSILINETGTPTPSPTAATPTPQTTASPTAATPTPFPSPSPSASPSPAKVVFSQPFNFTVGSQPSSVATADFTGNNGLDIVTGNADGSVTVLIDTGPVPSATPSYSTPFNFQATARPQPLTVAVADINGDGKPDIITANSIDGTVSVLLNTTLNGTTPTFNGPFTFGVGGGPADLAVMDINNDGYLDIITANTSGNVTILLGSTVPLATTPSFQPALTFNSGATAVSFALADFTGAGLTDFAVAGSDQSAHVLLNTTNQAVNGSPTPVPSATTSPTPATGAVNAPQTVVTFNAPQVFGLNGTPAWIATGTIAVGGHNDLISANSSNNNVSVLVNQSSGQTLTFVDGNQWNAGTSPVFVTLIDISGDGMLDAVVANEQTNQISVLINVSTPPPNSVTAANTVGTGTATGTTPVTGGTGTTTTGTGTGTGLGSGTGSGSGSGGGGSGGGL